MKDVFYTILVVWIIWRVLNSISAYSNKRNNNLNNSNQNNKRAVGETVVDYVPPIKNKINNDEGEYVDYEEMKS